MPQVFQLTDVDKIIYDACNSLEQIRAAGWDIYRASAKQPAVQVGALKQIADVTAKQVEMLQSVGKIEKAAEKLSTVNTVKVEMAGLGKRPTVKPEL